MSIWRLVFREIRHRKLNFALAVVSVLVAVGVLVAELCLLDSHDIRTRRIMRDLHASQQAEMKKLQARKMAELLGLQADQRAELARLQAQQRTDMAELHARQRAEMAKLEDDYRKIMLKLGLNVLILPKDQDLAEYSYQGYGSKFMPEEYATRLAGSKIVTVRHLLPTLEQKLVWPERRIEITLIGTRGEVPMLHRDPSKPIAEAVPEGKMVVGYELHKRLGISVGDRAVLKGAEFTVAKVHEERDPQRDFTIWIPLAKAQELLGKKGLINAIWALECGCAWAEIDKVRKEILAILPDTQVRELASQARTRAEARNRAKDLHEAALVEQQAAQARALTGQTAAQARALREERAAVARAIRDQEADDARALSEERDRRDRLGRQRRELAAWLVPLVVVGCAVWIALLAFSNVRQRQSEIGILRAIGLPGREILMVFLARAVLVGLLGAVLGYAVGFTVGAVASGMARSAAGLAALFRWWVPLAVLAVAPLLAALASWAPAILAAQQDPAVVLSQE